MRIVVNAEKLEEMGLGFLWDAVPADMFCCKHYPTAKTGMTLVTDGTEFRLECNNCGCAGIWGEIHTCTDPLLPNVVIEEFVPYYDLPQKPKKVKKPKQRTPLNTGDEILAIVANTVVLCGLLLVYRQHGHNTALWLSAVIAGIIVRHAYLLGRSLERKHEAVPTDEYLSGKAYGRLEKAVVDLLDDVNQRHPDKTRAAWKCPFFQRLSDLVGYGQRQPPEQPHPMNCFQHGGSGACEEVNRQHGFTCPVCAEQNGETS